ncbi:MAG: ribonuclease III [Ruminococcaceae bacterium]|nr:ribonuclease III [Oscillospiraceae bacterium]
MSTKGLPRDCKELESAIKYRFNDKQLLLTALTHSSFSNESKTKGLVAESNERLEFLGDSVLSIITSRYLYKHFPELPEGDLSRIRAKAVCEKTLYGFALDISLGDYLRLGHGEEMSNGRNRASILADAFEALLAAMYLDGGIRHVNDFLMPYIKQDIENTVRTGHLKDYKTLLQQIIQQEHGELLEYVVTDESGPAHNRFFTVEARLNSNVIGEGKGFSKQEAEQMAAKEALILFGAEA